MMKNCFIIFFISLVIISCKQSDQQELNLKVFKITIPKTWSYHPINSIDSFVGEIKLPHSTLYFDYSNMGYASSLTQTEEDFLKREVWNVRDLEHGARLELRKPNKEERLKLPNVDYFIDILDNSKVRSVLIKIPQEIKQVNVHFDTIRKYVVKTIWPKKPGIGETGIFFHGLHSNFSFCMSGLNLTKQEQTEALTAFKTLKFSNE